MAQQDLRRVERAALKAKKARTELRNAILLAKASGETNVDIGLAAGLSGERIRQILQEEEPD